jgi:hypothetical protein
MPLASCVPARPWHLPAEAEQPAQPPYFCYCNVHKVIAQKGNNLVTPRPALLSRPPLRPPHLPPPATALNRQRQQQRVRPGQRGRSLYSPVPCFCNHSCPFLCLQSSAGGPAQASVGRDCTGVPLVARRRPSRLRDSAPSLPRVRRRPGLWKGWGDLAARNAVFLHHH